MPTFFDRLLGRLVWIHPQINKDSVTFQVKKGTSLWTDPNVPLAQYLSTNGTIINEIEEYGGNSIYVNYNRNLVQHYATTDWTFVGGTYRYGSFTINLDIPPGGGGLPAVFMTCGSSGGTREVLFSLSPLATNPLIEARYNSVRQLDLNFTGALKVRDDTSNLQRAITEYSAPGNSFLMMGA
jgi:hypothetical protein